MTLTLVFTDTSSKCGLRKTSAMGSFPPMENLALTMPSCHWLAFLAAWYLNHFQTLSSNSTCCQGTLFHSVKTMTSSGNLPLQRSKSSHYIQNDLLVWSCNFFFCCTPVWFHVKTSMPNCCNLQTFSHITFSVLPKNLIFVEFVLVT